MTEVFDDYVKQCVEHKWVEVKWISLKEQIADIFTKPLSFEIHSKLTRKILNIDEITDL